jgi:hypothetical protein
MKAYDIAGFSAPAAIHDHHWVYRKVGKIKYPEIVRFGLTRYS